MSFATSFKSFGHAIAAGAKYFSKGVAQAIGIAQKAAVLEPAAEALIGAVAGPQAAAMSDIAFHLFGEVASALKPVADDQLAAVAENGINLKLDLAVVQDVKKFVGFIEAVLHARGTPPPAL